MFLLLEDPEFGVLTYVLEAVGLLDGTSPILATPATALAGVMLADVWQWTPFMVLIFIAGLRSLPSEPYEAAMLDGASAFQIFRRITLPLMSKVIAVAVLIRSIDLFRVFDYMFVMTSGGPGTSTYTLSLYAWQQTFSFIKWGYGATLSIVSLVLTPASPGSPTSAGRTPSEWDEMIDVNTKGVMNAVHAVMNGMMGRRHGTLVMMSSIAGRKVYPDHTVYCGTKYFVHGVSESLREYLSAYGVRVIVISPGVVETEVLDGVTDPETLAGYKENKAGMGGGTGADTVADLILGAYRLPQEALVQEICLTPTRQRY